MVYEWDETKREKNLAIHGVDFSAIELFDWEDAIVEMDKGRSYDETRYAALGPINGRLHAVVFTLRGENYRIISLRKANRREIKKWLEN
jgi:uncharacterized DUF497 family protein